MTKMASSSSSCSASSRLELTSYISEDETGDLDSEDPPVQKRLKRSDNNIILSVLMVLYNNNNFLLCYDNYYLVLFH